jgi:catalase
MLDLRSVAMAGERPPTTTTVQNGGGAHGFFEVTEDVTQWTSAAFLSEVGKRTPLSARFSEVAGALGGPGSVRDPRRFALKLYTEEGNYDLAGNNTPVYSVRDAGRLQDLISNDMQWDFWTLSPESAHHVAILMSDRGTPRSWRHMNGYGCHTHSWRNAGGERFWVKYHLKTVQGIENFTLGEANTIAGQDPDLHRRDLWNAIASGEAPEWRLELQVMPFDEAASYRFNPFDLTKVWPHGDYPPISAGRIVLDRNPENHLAEVEQAGFARSNLVPGIGLCPDTVRTGRCAYEQHRDDDPFVQAAALYREVMGPIDREHLVANVVAHATDGVSGEVQQRIVGYWTNVDPHLGANVAAGLSTSDGNGKRDSARPLRQTL